MLMGIGSVSTQQINWTRMFYSGFKIPYGTFVLKEVMPDLFDRVDRNRNSLLEITDTLTYPINVFSISNNFEPTDLEIEYMLFEAELGTNFVVSANYFKKQLLDTLVLDLDTANLFFGNQIIPLMDEGEFSDYRFSIKDFLIRDTVHIMATNKSFHKQEYVIKKRDIFSYFTNLDSTHVNVLATYHGNPILIETQFGEGKIILCSVPHIFSNIYLLQAENHPFVSYVMSRVPKERLVWTEFYEIGRGLSNTPLRFILGEPALKLALYTLLGSLVIFVLFEIKRKQRAIPIVKPLSNDSLDFVETIGNLYLESHQNSTVAQKRVQFFLDYIRTNFYLDTSNLDENFVQALARKSKIETSVAEELVKQVRFVLDNNQISDKLLLKLSNNLDEFYFKNQTQTS